MIVVMLSLATTRAQQCSGGDIRCPCVSSYGGLNVSVSGTDHAQDSGYGLHSCKAHDSNTAPYCNAAGFPSWCDHSWCYVSNCTLSVSSPSYSSGRGLRYSYETCDATDTFTSFYKHRDGVVNLCSVFAEAADSHQACGNMMGEQVSGLG